MNWVVGASPVNGRSTDNVSASSFVHPFLLLPHLICSQSFGKYISWNVFFRNLYRPVHIYTISGIGVDDMFLLMSSWSETLPITDLTIPERIGTVYKKAGIGITITSGN